MKTTSFDGSLERQSLIDAIASWEVADHLVRQFPDGPSIAGSSHAKLLFRWIYAYHPVSDGIPYSEGGFRRDWEGVGQEAHKDAYDGLKAFVSTMSGDWSARVPKAVSKAKEDASRYFRVCGARAFAERLTRAAESGDMTSFEAAQGSYRNPGVEEVAPVDILRDSGALNEAFSATDDVLFQFPGALGELMGPVIRGDFLAPLAREKMGKSWIVDYVAKTAAFQGCDTLVVDVEMVQKQKLRRIWRQLVGAPLVTGEYELPYFDSDGEICHRRRKVEGVKFDKASLDRQMGAFRRLANGGSLEVLNMPTRGAKVKDLENLMERRIQKRGKPYDFIIADSLDYFEPKSSRLEGIDKLFDIWSEFRGLGQKYNSALMSPSHTGRKSKKGSGSEDDVAGNIQKLWMVTKTLFIEATKAEQEAGVLRATTSTSRDNRMRDDTVVLLQGLDIARPVLDSRWLSEVKGDKVFRGNLGKFGKDLD